MPGFGNKTLTSCQTPLDSSSCFGRRSPAPGQSPTVGLSRLQRAAGSPRLEALLEDFPTLQTLTRLDYCGQLRDPKPVGKGESPTGPPLPKAAAGWGGAGGRGAGVEGGKCARRLESGRSQIFFSCPPIRHDSQPRPGSGIGEQRARAPTARPHCSSAPPTG